MNTPERPLIKICGITNIEDAILCLDLGADLLGVILDDNVGRHGDRKLIDQIISAGGRACAVYTSMEQITGQARNESAAQLHFEFTEEDLHNVRETDIPVIGVASSKFRIPVLERFSIIDRLGVDFALVDFDDGVANHINDLLCLTGLSSLALAGRIRPRDIQSILGLKPALIDVSSTLEASIGRKDGGKVREFFETVEALLDVSA